MKKESRSQTRSATARQQTPTRNAENIISTRKQSKKVTVSVPVTYGTPSKDTKSASKSRSTDSSVSSGRSRETKQTSSSDIASHDRAVASATGQEQREPDAVSDSSQQNVSSSRKDKTVGKTPDRSALKSRRWVRGGPIEYSTPPSDQSSGHGSVADKQKSSSGSHDSKKGKSSLKKNITLAFEVTDKEADAKQRYKDSDSVRSTAAGGKRKKDTAQQDLTAEGKGSSTAKGTSRKNAKSSSAVKIEPETTRTKRMARLNAEAIVSLIYKQDEPAAKSSKFYDSDSDIDTDSSEFSSYEEHQPVAKKSRAKISQSQEDLAGTSENDGERASHPPSKKREMQSDEKRSASKSEKSPKRTTKASSKSCKKKTVETVSSSSWSPPKRMASLNAQVCSGFNRMIMLKVFCIALLKMFYTSSDH